jgi:hypothetical protein
MKNIIIIFCFLYGLLGQGLCQEKQLTKKQMYADFDELISILQDCNPQLAVRKAVTGIDNLELAKSLRSVIDTINDKSRFDYLLSNVLECMYDIHAEKTNKYYAEYDNLKGIDTIILNYREQNPKPAIRPFRLMGHPIYIDNDYFLGYVYKFINLETNDTLNVYYSKIISYNDMPYKEYVKETLNKYPSSGVRWEYKKKEYYHVFPTIPFAGVLTVEDQGKIIDIDLNQRYGVYLSNDTFIKINIAKNNEKGLINETILYLEKDKILFIGLKNMNDPENKIAKQIKEIAKDKLINKVIIDVRNNTGGSDLVWHSILKAIIADSLPYNPVMAFKNTKRIKKLYDYSNAFYDIKKLDIKQFEWLPGESFLVTNFEPNYIVPDSNSLNYKEKIYILQDEEVYSAGHSLASYARHIEQLVSVGEPSGLLAGFGLNPALFQLKYSKFTFRLETAIDVSNATKPEDVYQNMPEIIINIPSDKKLEYKKDWYYDRHCEEYLYTYDYLFQRILEME